MTSCEVLLKLHQYTSDLFWLQRGASKCAKEFHQRFSSQQREQKAPFTIQLEMPIGAAIFGEHCFRYWLKEPANTGKRLLCAADIACLSE